jgi:DNA modification methylase
MDFAVDANTTRAEVNKLRPEDRAAHDWYRFVLSFPPHLVRTYLRQFNLNEGQRVLDPFCGTGTTLVECKKQGIGSVGIEANPMACFASRVKTSWQLDPQGLRAHGARVAKHTRARLARYGIRDPAESVFTAESDLGPGGKRPNLKKLPAELQALLLADCISPLPLHKTLVLLEVLQEFSDPSYLPYEQLALAKAVVFSISNLHFGPEVGVRPARRDAPVVSSWLTAVNQMARDLAELKEQEPVSCVVHQADARQLVLLLEPESIAGVITSPPYPNEKDYTRTTRLESVLLGMITSKGDLRSLKHRLVRSNTRGVYKGDDDDRWVENHPEIQRLAQAIEARRVQLGKTSGFERLYARVTRLYFGGMARHLADLRRVLRPGAQLAYVVGDQASYLRIMIRTGQLLADLAQSLGYELVGIDLFRTRRATATREQLREEVVVLRWPG